MIVKEYQRLSYGSGEGGLRDRMALPLWLKAYSERTRNDVEALVVAYISGATITDCLNLLRNDNDCNVNVMLDWFVEELRRFPLDELFDRVKNTRYALEESVENIPQLSSIDSSTLDIIDLLSVSETPLTYVRLGYHLYGSSHMRNEVAKRKYGENAAKFAALLDLVRLGHDIKDPSAPNRIAVEVTAIGKAVARACGDRKAIVARLLLRSALFRDLVGADCAECANKFMEIVSQLSEQTRVRRTSAFSAMLHMYQAYGGTLSANSQAEEMLCRMRH